MYVLPELSFPPLVLEMTWAAPQPMSANLHVSSHERTENTRVFVSSTPSELEG